MKTVSEAPVGGKATLKKSKQETIRKELNFMRIVQVKAYENNYLFIFSKDI